jgi:hypothetical protein
MPATTETPTALISRLYDEGAGLTAIVSAVFNAAGDTPDSIKLIARQLGLSTKPGTKLDYAVIAVREAHDRKLGAEIKAKREANRIAEPNAETKLAQATTNPPETIWETWNEISAAITEAVETWNTETLLYLAQVEGNDLVKIAAAHELEVREALGD